MKLVLSYPEIDPNMVITEPTVIQFPGYALVTITPDDCSESVGLEIYKGYAWSREDIKCLRKVLKIIEKGLKK